MQTDQLEHIREKHRMAQDETRSMQAKNEVLERFVENCSKTASACSERQSQRPRVVSEVD